MNRSARALAAAVATAALTLTGQALQTAASAKPDHAGSHAKGGQAKGAAAQGDSAKVLRDIARTSAALDRTVRENRIGSLAEDIQAAVVAGVEADKAGLAELAAAVAAPDGTQDLRQVRRDLHQLRPENYVLSVNVLRKAARVAGAAADDAEATALVDSAVALALSVNASSPKSLLREARADLADAQALLDADEVDTTEQTDPATEPTAPVTG